MKKFFKFFNLLGPVLFLGMLLLFLFWQVFFQGAVVIGGDNFDLNIPLKFFFVYAMHHHFFPLWNPFILGGIPYAADLNLGTFNVLNIVYLFFSVPRAYTMQIILDIFFIGYFQYLFLRTFLVKKLHALVGAVAFMLSGTVFVFTSNSTILNTIVYIPLLFLFSKKLFVTQKLRFYYLLVFFQMLQIVAGHPQITYYTIFFVCLFIFWQGQFSMQKRVLVVISYLFSTLLLSSFQLVPFLELVIQSNRPVGDLAYASSGSFGIFHVITIFFPTFFGTKLYGNWWGPQTMLFGYISIAGLLLFYFGLRFGKLVQKNFFRLSLMLSFLLSLGKWGGVYILVYYIMPGWSAFRSPADIFVFVTFFASIFIANGLEAMTSHRKYVIQVSKKLISFSEIFLVIVGGVLLLTTFSTHWFQIFQYLHKMHIPFMQRILFYSRSKIQSMFTGITINVFTSLCFLFLACIILLKLTTRPKTLALFLLLLVTIDLLFADRTYVQLGPEQVYTNISPLLKHVTYHSYRVFPLPLSLRQDKRNLPGATFFYRQAALNTQNATDDHAVAAGVLSITGYNAFVLKNYAAFLQSTDITGITPNLVTQQNLNQFAVRYIISFDKNNATHIQENISAQPRARLTNQKNGSVIFTQDTPNRISLSVRTPIKNTLILADNYYTGWKAYVNGKISTIRRYEKVFRAVAIPAGQSTIIFTYDPLSWKIGIGISFVSFVGLGMFAYLNRRYV